MTNGVVIQARMTSSRFPGKSMAMLAGKPVLQHVIERCQMDILEVGAGTGANLEAIRRLYHSIRLTPTLFALDKNTTGL